MRGLIRRWLGLPKECDLKKYIDQLNFDYAIQNKIEDMVKEANGRWGWASDLRRIIEDGTREEYKANLQSEVRDIIGGLAREYEQRIDDANRKADEILSRDSIAEIIEQINRLQVHTGKSNLNE